MFKIKGTVAHGRGPSPKCDIEILFLQNIEYEMGILLIIKIVC